MRNNIIIILIVFCSLLQAQKGKQEFPWENDGQQKDVIRIPTRYNFSVNHRPPINFNIFIDLEEGNHNLQIHVGTAVLYDLLLFQKEEGAYKAKYQVSLAIRNERSTLIKKSWKEEVTLDDFAETNAKNKYDIKFFSLPANGSLTSGPYEALLEIHDVAARKDFRSRRSISIPAAGDKDGNQTLHTNLTFIMDSTAAGNQLQVSPSESVLEFGKHYALLTRLAVEKMQPVEMSLRLYYSKNEEEELYLREYLTLTPDSGLVTFCYSLPGDSMPEGLYKIRVQSEDPVIEMEKTFSVIWFDKPVYLYKSDLALEPMSYLLSEEEFERVESLSRDELSEWIHQYWKSKDPSPETDYNEISTEFFSRVHSANQRFGHKYKKGWQTDRGRILILYGEPHKIENNRYSTTKLPYIVWKYKNGEEFLFVDRNNDEDFILIELIEENR